MTVVVQEFDGNFSHTIQVEDISTTHELPCHSKIRKYEFRFHSPFNDVYIDMYYVHVHVLYMYVYMFLL